MLSKTILNVIKLQQKNFVRTPATVSVPIDVYDVDEEVLVTSKTNSKVKKFLENLKLR